MALGARRSIVLVDTNLAPDARSLCATFGRQAACVRAAQGCRRARGQPRPLRRSGLPAVLELAADRGSRFQVVGGDAVEATLAELARPVWDAAEAAALEVKVRGGVERSVRGAIEPLVPMAGLVVTPDAVSFRALSIRLASLRTTSTERTDTLQLATASEMWQFRVRKGSVFRLQRAIDRWRGRGPASERGAGPPAVERDRHDDR